MRSLADFEFWALKNAYPKSPDLLKEGSNSASSKLDLLGAEAVKKLEGKTVVDFGCGRGDQTLEMARRGVALAIGLDIREDQLEIGRRRALAEGLDDKCFFTASMSEPVDIIVSTDAFEHFDDPAGILRIMSSLLRPGGELLVSFGPTWYHPLGGHIFSVFPWAHLIFSEEALMRWRSMVKKEHLTRFKDVSGGLNQMSIKRFKQLCDESDFRIEKLECVPIRKLRMVHNRLTREFTTAMVRGLLVRR